MDAYHHMLVHLPVALWSTGVLIVVLRTFSAGPLAVAADRVLAPLLWLGALGGLLALVSGLFVWGLEATIHSPLGRNQLLVATWTFAFWVVLAALRQGAGPVLWEGGGRWLMLVLAVLGGFLVATTGTLGGHLTGSSTAFSRFLEALGWQVYTTFYLPGWMIVIVAVVGLLLAGMGRGAARAREVGR